MRGGWHAWILAGLCVAPTGCDADSSDPDREMLSVRIVLENVSSPGALATSDGGMHDIVLSSGVAAAHVESARLFDLGSDVAGTGLEALAEDGNPAPLHDELHADPAAFAAVVRFSAAYGAGEDGDLLGPMNVVEQEIVAPAGTRLSFVMMFVQSNDVILATAPEGLELVPSDTRDVTASLQLYDVGTEVDQEPGVGPDQAPRQAAAGTGTPQDGTVAAADASEYPAVATFLVATLEIAAADDG